MDLFNLVVTVIGGLFALVLGLFSGRRLNQERVVSSLKTLVEAQDKRIELLEAQSEEQTSHIADQDKQISILTQQVADLTRLTVQQALALTAQAKGMNQNSG